MSLKKVPKINQLKEDDELYKALVQQLNKDLVLAGVDYYSFSEKIRINELITALTNTIERLFKGRYDSYLNFIYRVDVAEKEMLLIDTESRTFFNDITKVVLKRELQKVWFRSKF